MSVLPPLPVAVPLAAAAVLLLVNSIVPRWAFDAVAVSAAMAEIVICAVLIHQARRGTIVHWFGGWTPRHGAAIGVSFAIDSIGAGAALLSGVVVVAAVIITRPSLRPDSSFVHALLMTLLAATAGFCLTGDLFNMFVFFELMAVSGFGLAAYHTEDRAGLRGALNFGITNSLGAFFVLAGIALLYGRTGALNLAQIGRQLAADGRVDRLVVVAFTVIVVGFLIKAAVVPFHFWLIDTASSAPLPLTIILAGVLDAIGLFAVARVYWTVFGPVFAGRDSPVQTTLMTIGVITALLAAVLSLGAPRYQRRLAFVMVSHTGIQLIGIACLSALGLAGWAMYAVADGLVKAALFGGVFLLGPGLQSAEEEKGASWLAIALVAAGGLAVAGLPLFGTGAGKSVIEDASRAAGYGWVIPALVVASALTGAAVLLIALAALDGPRGPLVGGGTIAAVSAALLALSIAVGFALTGWALAAAGRFIHPEAAGPARSVGLSTGGVVLDLVGVAGAVLLALAWRRSPRPSALTARTMLWRLHAGSIGDSAAWVTVGAAGVGFALAFALH
jgi:multicomponent Na+:H+ antiporter subunit D